MTEASLASMRLSDGWALSESVLDDLPILIRLRTDIGNFVGHPLLSWRLRIVWAYDAENEMGLPQLCDLELMEACENALVAVFEKDKQTILTHVITADGVRQWVFYSQDLDEAAARLNSVLPHDQPYPLELSAEEDSSWSEYCQTMQSSGLVVA